MDNYDEELLNVAKLPFNEITSDYKIIMLSNKVLYLCNFIKILDYSDTKIAIKVKRNKSLTILGKNLYICQINKREIVIKGDIDICDFGAGNGEK